MNKQTSSHSHHLEPKLLGRKASKRTASWRRNLLSLANAATRIHRYRNLHTRMVRESLVARRRHLYGDMDCGNE